MNVPNIIAYCQQNNIDICENDFYESKKLRLEQNKRDGIFIAKWDLPIPKPTLKDLEQIDADTIKTVEKNMKKKGLRENELFPLVERLCEKLNIDINEII